MFIRQSKKEIRNKNKMYWSIKNITKWKKRKIKKRK